MNVFQWVAGLVQQSLTTNTVMEIAGSIADIHFNHKRARSAICLTMSLAGVGGGATLCILQPTLISYFTTQAVPFLGTIAGTIFAGCVGGWFGGGIGHNLAKEIIRQVAERNLGHSNTAYAFNDADVARIVDENPQIYNYNFDAEQGYQDNDVAGIRAQDIQALKQILLSIRDQIDEHKKDGSTAHDEYKYALLSALRLSNLFPMLELFSKADTKREVRKQAAAKTINYLADVDVAGFLAGPQVGPQAGQPPRQPRHPRARRAQPRPAAAQPQVGENVANMAVPPVVPVPPAPVPAPVIPAVPLVAEGHPAMEPVEVAPMARAARAARAAPVELNPEFIELRGNFVHNNLRRYIDMLNQGIVKDVRRVKRPNVEPVLNPYEARELLVSLKHTYQEQTQKQVSGRNNAAPLLSKALPRPGRRV